MPNAFNSFSLVVARMVDQTAKWGLNIDAAIQRLGQLRAKGDFIADSLFVNCAVQVCFGGLDPESARFLTELFSASHVDLQQYKEATRRPVAVGQEKQTVANWSRGEMQAVSEMTAHTRSHSRGTAYATSSTLSTATGSGIGSGDSVGQVLTPPFSLFGPNAPNASMIPTPLSQSRGSTSSESAFNQSSESSSESFTEIETESEADTHARGTSRGTSQSEGASECFTTVYEWMPSQLYSLEEQLFRLTGELMAQPRRQCVVKIEHLRPFSTSTVDLTPAFRCDDFRAHMLPLFLASTAKNSPYLAPISQVDAEIAARLSPALPQPRKPDPESWSEPVEEYPDPPPPPDAARVKPSLRVVRPDEVDGRRRR